MLERFPLPPQARAVLELARSDRAAAARALGGLSVDEQVAVVCSAPLPRRGELLDLLPHPEQVVPRVPEAELCFSLKAIGLADAVWLLGCATGAQIAACVDLDAWTGTELDRAVLDGWIDALAELDDEAFLRSLGALDPELLVLFLQSRVEAWLKPDDDDGWQPPPGAQTLDGQFYFAPRKTDDDTAAVLRVLRALFEKEYWTYFRMLQGITWEPAAENEEWALRWRTGRLQDLGFPAWEEAMGIYRFVPPAERAALPEGEAPLAQPPWRLPVWMPGLPAGREAEHAVFRAIAELGAEERRAVFFAFVATANKLAVADRMPLGDAESTPRAIEKVARFASDGLEFIAHERALPPAEVLRRVSLERLFRVGANLDPRGARRREP